MEDNDIGKSANVWKELGVELNKRPQNKPLAAIYSSNIGVLDVDYNPTLHGLKNVAGDKGVAIMATP